MRRLSDILSFQTFSGVAALLLATCTITAFAAPGPRDDDPDTPRLYFLAQNYQNITGRIMSIRPDGTDLRTVLRGLWGGPDGIAVDKDAGYIYFSQMGVQDGLRNNGTINRINIDGSDWTVLVGNRTTHTPKQLILAETDGKKMLYWGDREGMRVMRANVDGTGVETLVSTKGSRSTDASTFVVGVAVDTVNNWIYWSQKGAEDAGRGSIHRAPLHKEPTIAASNRTDAQTLLTGLPEPIDLRWIPTLEALFWTDRGNRTGGNSVNKLKISKDTDIQELAGKITTIASLAAEAIGIAVDEEAQTVYYDNLEGALFACGMDGSWGKIIKEKLGLLTGMDLVK